MSMMPSTGGVNIRRDDKKKAKKAPKTATIGGAGGGIMDTIKKGIGGVSGLLPDAIKKGLGGGGAPFIPDKGGRGQPERGTPGLPGGPSVKASPKQQPFTVDDVQGKGTPSTGNAPNITRPGKPVNRNANVTPASTPAPSRPINPGGSTMFNPATGRGEDQHGGQKRERPNLPNSIPLTPKSPGGGPTITGSGFGLNTAIETQRPEPPKSPPPSMEETDARSKRFQEGADKIREGQEDLRRRSRDAEVDTQIESLRSRQNDTRSVVEDHERMNRNMQDVNEAQEQGISIEQQQRNEQTQKVQDLKRQRHQDFLERTDHVIGDTIDPESDEAKDILTRDRFEHSPYQTYKADEKGNVTKKPTDRQFFDPETGEKINAEERLKKARAESAAYGQSLKESPESLKARRQMIQGMNIQRGMEQRQNAADLKRNRQIRMGQRPVTDLGVMPKGYQPFVDPETAMKQIRGEKADQRAFDAAEAQRDRDSRLTETRYKYPGEFPPLSTGGDYERNPEIMKDDLKKRAQDLKRRYPNATEAEIQEMLLNDQEVLS